MNTKYNVTRFLAISTLALALPLTSFAYGRSDNGRDHNQDRPRAEMRHGGGMLDLRGIDLSADQITQLRSLRDEQRKLFAEKMPAMRAQHDALQKLIVSDDYTPQAAAEMIKKITVTQAEMAQLRADEGNKLYKILTPEQRIRVQQNELIGGGSMGRRNKR